MAVNRGKFTATRFSDALESGHGIERSSDTLDDRVNVDRDERSSRRRDTRFIGKNDQLDSPRLTYQPVRRLISSIKRIPFGINRVRSSGT